MPTSTQGPAGAPPATTDRGTQLAEERTALALQRSYLAAERTLMAWLRTALSMISFGFTMVKFFEYLESERGPVVGLFGRTWAPTTVGIGLMVIGILALVAAIVQHRQMIAALHREGLAPGWSLALSVATLVAVLGVFALGSLFIR
jgi:putative membrane protein